MQDNDFSPDTIDAQTGQDTANLPAEHARLVCDLHRLHQSAAAKNAASLARVQARLVEHEQHALKRPLAQPPTPHLTSIKERYMASEPSTRSGHVWRRLSVIAASLLLVVLVGSMAALFTRAHQSKLPSPANNHPTVATEPPDPAPARGLYLFIGSDSGAQISKLDPQTRQTLWTKDAGSAEGPLVVYGNTLYALDSTGDYPNETNGIAAFSAQDGTLLWHSYFSQDNSFHAPNGSGPYDLGMFTQPTVTGGIVYTLARDGKLYALDAKTGRQLWNYTASATVLIQDPVTFPDGKIVYNYGIGQMGPVTVVNGVVYGAIHNALFAVDAKTGKQLWSNKIDEVLFFNSPVSVNGVLYLSSQEESHGHSGQSQQGYVYAYHPQNGSVIWRHTVGNWVLTPPTVVGGVVYFGSYDDHLYALKASDGSQLWSHDLGGHIFDQPFFYDGTIIVGELGNGGEDTGSATVGPALFALNATSGAQVWREDMSKDGYELQDVQDGQIYLGVFPGALTILSTRDGSQIWSQVYNQQKDKYGNNVGAPPIITLVF
jgi:outer membrane protein assembly factor BamB